MGEKIVVGPVSKGLRTGILPFNIDNDAFSTLINAYQWRARLKRKRGTQLLNRLQRFFNSTDKSYNSGMTTITLDGTGSGNLLINASWTLQANATLVPGTITITDTSNANETYTDPALDGILVGSTGGTGTINYASGAFTITGGAGHVVSAKFVYYPDLPVMGLRDFLNVSSQINAAQFPGTIAFDTTYSYNIVTTAAAIPPALFPVYDVSFYKNPPVSASLPGYVPKTTVTPTTWNGQDYQQFWTTNYQGALWATNGISVPFSPTNVGMQFQKPFSATWVNATTIDFVIIGSPLVVGDFVFANEWSSATPANAQTLNFQTGYVTAVNSGTNTYTVVFPNANIANDTYSGGILQYLTTRSDVTRDCLRWYDGDPTNGSSTAPVLNGNRGWVNFMPPISQSLFGIADLQPAQYYLIGARMIYQFKDRIIFFAPVVQTSSANSQVYLQDTIIYSQNGTPYYTSSFQGNPISPTSIIPVLVPQNQTATPSAYFADQTGFGGNITAGVDQEILTLGPNEDVLIVGFTRLQTRLIYSGSDIVPFNFFIINSELGSGSTFSAITLDKGIMTKGSRGYIITSQTESRRFDLDIPDQVFQVNLMNNGTERVTSQRDYVNEWVYFTYPSNSVTYKYPNQTLQYNYREDTWAIFNETYTTYGTFRETTGLIWATVGNTFPTWEEWNQPWNSGSSTAEIPKVIGGNAQGFILIRDEGTAEATSLFIQNIVGMTVTSPNHCLNDGDYIVITGALGTVSSYVNGHVYSVQLGTTNTFQINGPGNTIPPNSATYLGSGVIQRAYVPYIQSKQFPLGWSAGRKTRLGVQQYLLTKTANSQITLLIFLSQDASDAWNDSPILPNEQAINDSLIYSTVLFTSPENYAQACSNLSFGNIGNGVLTTFTFNYQTSFNLSNAPFIPGSIFISVGLAGSFATFKDNGTGGFTVTGNGTSVGSTIDYLTNIVVIQFTVAPTNQLTSTNFQYSVNNIQSPTAGAQQQIWHRMNTSLLGDTVQVGFTMSDEQMRDTTLSNQFAEIEIHGFILDVEPSSLLA